MKRTLAVLFALSLSSPAWAAGYSTGTFQCATKDNSITAVWKVSAFNANLPYIEVSINDTDYVTTAQGIGTVETEAGGTLIGIPCLDTGGFYVMSFNTDGTIQVGDMICTQTGT